MVFILLLYLEPWRLKYFVYSRSSLNDCEYLCLGQRPFHTSNAFHQKIKILLERKATSKKVKVKSENWLIIGSRGQAVIFFFFLDRRSWVFLAKFKNSYCNSFGDDSRSVVWVSLLHWSYPWNLPLINEVLFYS